ncbi:transposable element tc1 transposase protein [Rutstroemia sp. NJR-2017a BBW]|nr:transposable element tc1 transposase protein [Rutstroemia sp. NJR-2017a BBW]
MASEYHIPTPKQPRSAELSRDDRLRIHTLFFDANWSRDDIVLYTGFTYKQVCDALKHRLTPQKSKCGLKPRLTTPERKRLVDWVSASADNREIPWIAIPQILKLNCSHKAIRTAFKKEGYIRAVARRKPPLSEANKEERMQWAEEHLNWTEEQWDLVCWSDETWTQPGRHRSVGIERIKELVHTMPARCRAVIDAKGGPIPY